MTQRVKIGFRIGNIAARLDLSASSCLPLRRGKGQNRKFPHSYTTANGLAVLLSYPIRSWCMQVQKWGFLSRIMRSCAYFYLKQGSLEPVTNAPVKST
jgi:hypothetical protein